MQVRITRSLKITPDDLRTHLEEVLRALDAGRTVSLHVDGEARGVLLTVADYHALVEAATRGAGLPKRGMRPRRR